MARNGKAYGEFLSPPKETTQRQYEALRGVFLEERPVKQDAREQGVSQGTLQNWVGEFRTQFDTGQRPPFS